MANDVRGPNGLPVAMTPVRTASTPRVREVDRGFVDALTRARSAGVSRRASSAASASAAGLEPAAASPSRASLSRSGAAAAARSARVAPQAASTAAEPLVAAAAEAPRRPIAPRVPSSGSSEIPRDADGTIISKGTLSEDPHTEGMYVPPDFYHGNSYSPVFDRQDENGNWVPTPRFEGQKIYSRWRGSLPPGWDPNARVIHDPLLEKQGPRWWKQDENGDWVRRPEGPGGIALLDDGNPINTPKPSQS